MTKDVQPGPDPSQRCGKFLTADHLATRGHIEDSVRRSVRQQDIGSDRDARPDLTKRLSSIGIERPVEKARLPRTSIDPETLQHTRFVLQIDRAREQGARVLLLFKQKVVIARDDHLVSMRLCREPLVEVADFAGSSSLGEVAGADQNVTVGNAQLSMLSVGVADADNPHAVDDSAA